MLHSTLYTFCKLVVVVVAGYRPNVKQAMVLYQPFASKTGLQNKNIDLEISS
jgi:hypothetical protein